MDPKKNFSEDDKKKVVQFLNFITQHATFTINTNESIEYVRALSYMQQTLLSKIESNYFEIVQVVEPAKEEAPVKEGE